MFEFLVRGSQLQVTWMDATQYNHNLYRLERCAALIGCGYRVPYQYGYEYSR